MYVRTVSRKNKDGSTVTYVQLANNVWDKEKGYARAEVIYSFGKIDVLDIDAIRRLVKSLWRFFSPEDSLKSQTYMESQKRQSNKRQHLKEDRGGIEGSWK